MASEVARGSSRRGRGRDILRGDKINWPWRLNAVVVCIGAIGSVWMLFGWGGRSFFFPLLFLLCICVFMFRMFSVGSLSRVRIGVFVLQNVSLAS